MLLDTVQSDLKLALVNKEELKLSTLRLLLSEIKNEQIKKGNDLTDSEMISIVHKEIKKRREASEGFKSGNRQLEATKEDNEAKILETYLPKQLTNEELTKLIDTAINKLDASSIKDMGKVIGYVMTQVGQTADGGRVSSIVKDRLS